MSPAPHPKPPTRAPSLHASGLKAFRAGDFETAAAKFEEARAAYDAAGDMLMAAEMANNLAVAHLSLNRFEAAAKAVEPTIELFRQSGDRLREAQARGNLAAACSKLGQFGRAAAEFQQSADAFAELGDGEQRAASLRSLSEVQLKQGKALDAVASMQAGLSGVKRPSLAQRTARQLLKVPFKLLGR